MRRVAEGGVDALATLYERFAAVLFPLALRILRQRAEAEDAVHDVFVTAAERASQYVAERGSVATWLIVMTRNLAIDRVRWRVRHGESSDPLALGRIVEPRASAEVTTALGQTRAKVRHALASLPPLQRTTLEIAFFEGLTFAEIATRMGVPLGTVKSRAARAAVSLREALEREGLSLETLAAHG